MRARHKNNELRHRLDRQFIDIPTETCGDLRRAELTLQRWAERECGDGSNTWIERDEKTGKPFTVYHESGGRHPTPDREAGALRRIAAICKDYSLYFFHQTDPRGCMLYVGNQKLTEQNYSTAGVHCSVE